MKLDSKYLNFVCNVKSCNDDKHLVYIFPSCYIDLSFTVVPLLIRPFYKDSILHTKISRRISSSVLKYLHLK